jgi:hypothetical protein
VEFHPSGVMIEGERRSSDIVDKLRRMLAFVDDMEDHEQLSSRPAWSTR